jgi:membrane-anchored protein YejM (alkaline phosphatase superfamily)
MKRETKQTLTRRDHFAKTALNALIVAKSNNEQYSLGNLLFSSDTREEAALAAYLMADAMLAVRQCDISKLGDDTIRNQRLMR